MAVRVNICGITNKSDALAAVEFGADALGFIFYRASQRFVEQDVAAEIIRELPPFVTKVGVFVDAQVEEIRETTRACGISTVQLHGRESPEFCEEIAKAGLDVIKAFRMKNAGSVGEIEKFRTKAYLLDSYVPGELGGTGAVFNWDLAKTAKQSGRPIILAGGLTPKNITFAVESVQPYGVDVSSGVEVSPGKKDLEKVRSFIERAKGAA